MLLLLLLGFVAWTSHLPEQGLYLVFGLGSSLFLIGLNLLKWSWAGPWCLMREGCRAPAEVWGALPLFLLAGLALSLYFGWRISAVRLFHFLR